MSEWKLTGSRGQLHWYLYNRQQTALEAITTVHHTWTWMKLAIHLLTGRLLILTPWYLSYNLALLTISDMPIKSNNEPCDASSATKIDNIKFYRSKEEQVLASAPMSADTLQVGPRKYRLADTNAFAIYSNSSIDEPRHAMSAEDEPYMVNFSWLV